MRQRNVSGGPLHIPDIPAYVLPGEDIDWVDALAGFEPVDDPPPPTGKSRPTTSSTTRDDVEGAGK